VYIEKSGKKREKKIHFFITITSLFEKLGLIILFTTEVN